MFLIPPLTFFYLASHWNQDEEADDADRRADRDDRRWSSWRSPSSRRSARDGKMPSSGVKDLKGEFTAWTSEVARGGR